MSEFLLQVHHLKKYFPVRRGLFQRVVGHVKAVDDVSFGIRPGETLGLVGESGCGKTTVGRTLLRLYEPTSGRIEFAGQDVTPLQGRALRALRRDLQIVFQDPFSSLNPRMTVRSIIEDYECLGAMPDDKVVDGLRRAEARLHELRATSNDVPPRRRRQLANLVATAPFQASVP